jgi:glycosyltransferase involved in cell wall biosynthesis
MRIADIMEPHGFESVAFCAGGRTSVFEAFAEQGLEAVGYVPAEVSYRRPANFLRSSLELACEFRRRKIDLVHCSDLLAAYHAGLAGRLARVPVMCHIRCDYSDISRRDQIILRTVERFVFVSRETMRTFPYRKAARRGAVLYDGIELDSSPLSATAREDVRSEFGIPRESVIIGMVARLAPIKDYRTLITAAARVIHQFPDTRFLIVGDTSGADNYRRHFAEVQEMLRAEGIADHFTFTGFRDDVTRLVGAMDIVTLVTHSEGLPLVLLEAMAQEKPVVATAVGGIPEIVHDGRTGLLHDHEDAVGLANAFLSLLGDAARRRELGLAAREYVEANFRNERFAGELARLYGDLLGARE